MKTRIDWALGADVRVRDATHKWGRVDAGDCAGWSIPVSGMRKTVDGRPQHGCRIQDLPMQAGRVIHR
jgi:hypothetical protein